MNPRANRFNQLSKDRQAHGGVVNEPTSQPIALAMPSYSNKMKSSQRLGAEPSFVEAAP